MTATRESKGESKEVTTVDASTQTPLSFFAYVDPNPLKAVLDALEKKMEHWKLPLLKIEQALKNVKQHASSTRGDRTVMRNNALEVESQLENFNKYCKLFARDLFLNIQADLSAARVNCQSMIEAISESYDLVLNYVPKLEAYKDQFIFALDSKFHEEKAKIIAPTRQEQAAPTVRR